MRDIYQFFADNNCTKFEQEKLIVRLAEFRYESTLAMLKRIMRKE